MLLRQGSNLGDSFHRLCVANPFDGAASLKSQGLWLLSGITDGAIPKTT